MKNYYDIIIIGAGPSGSSCALNCQRFFPDLSVLLLDKDQFPRLKPCGGGVSQDVEKFLGFKIPPSIQQPTTHIVIKAANKKAIIQPNGLLMVRRENFDQHLVTQCQKAGVNFLDGSKVSLVCPEKNEVTLSSHKTLKSKIIVIAEGGKGRLAKQVGLDCNLDICAALEYEHPTPPSSPNAYFSFDEISAGYAWNFNKIDGQSIGVGGILKGKRNKPNLHKALKTYMNNDFEIHSLNKELLQGHPIKLYTRKNNLVNNTTLLIGECAGCVDPLTAEGIRPAIQSGYLAAQAICQHLKANKPLKNYNKLFHRHIGKPFSKIRYCRQLMFRFPEQLKPFASSDTAAEKMMNVFTGKLSYNDIVSLKTFYNMTTRVLKNRCAASYEKLKNKSK